MRRKWMRHSAAIALTALLVALSATWLLADKRKGTDRMDERQRAIHALNRLTFGPRPGDVDRVLAMGVDKWIDLQLHPEKIDDSALQSRLDQFRTLKMQPREMLAQFPPPQLVKQVADGKMSMPRDPEQRAVYEAAIAKYENKQEKKQAKNTADDAQTQEQSASDAMTPEEQAARREARQQARADADRLLSLSPDDRMKAILNLQPTERDRLVRVLAPQEKMQLLDGMSPKQKETLLALANPQAVIPSELMQAKLERAVYSERQLDEVMTDFWFNHFNIDARKGPERALLTEYEREVIRPHVLGHFRDLLEAT
ncbi:MAG TPA: DUF1800 family protein, partial [Terriglobales bacterium]|nr:DUF1800 family protein [Terriglobales bacterium]